MKELFEIKSGYNFKKIHGSIRRKVHKFYEKWEKGGKKGSGKLQVKTNIHQLYRKGNVIIANTVVVSEKKEKSVI